MKIDPKTNKSDRNSLKGIIIKIAINMKILTSTPSGLISPIIRQASEKYKYLTIVLLREEINLCDKSHPTAMANVKNGVPKYAAERKRPGPTAK